MTLVDTGSALQNLCHTVGLDGSDAIVLAAHATVVYRLPRENVVVRLSRGTAAETEASRTVGLCRWLNAHDFPAPAPVAVQQPAQLGGYVATFWSYYPQDTATVPPLADLGHLLRRLHQLPPPPVELPEYRPLDALPAAVESSERLSETDKSWLLEQYHSLLDRYRTLDSPLGIGHIHGDAYQGNLLFDGSRVLLADWDEASIGPRELDLANTYHGIRFGQRPSQFEPFATAYGHAVDRWPGLATLLAMRDVHTLSAYIRRADHGDAAAERELRYRIDTLRRGDVHARWNSSARLSFG